MPALLIEQRKNECSVLLHDAFREDLFNAAIKKISSQEKLAQYLSEKLNKPITREQVKSWKNGKHVYGWKIFTPFVVLSELAQITGVTEKDILSQVDKYDRLWLDPRKSMLLVSATQNVKLMKKDAELYVDLLSLLPERTLETQRARKHIPLFYTADEKIINLWSEASWQKSCITIKRQVELNNLFFEGLALYASEGVTKTINAYNGGIYFGNSEPSIINLFLAWLDSILLNYNPVFCIDFNGCSIDENKIKSFWASNIDKNMNVENIKIRLRRNLGSDLLKNYGIFQVKINNTVLKSFIIELLEKTKPLILSNSEYAIYYLKGLLAAEGSVSSKGVLKAVSIGCVNKEQRTFISKILNKLKLNYSMGQNQFSITGWESFYKLYRADAFEILQVNNYSKKQRFLEGLKAHQFTNGIIKLRDFAEKEFTAQDWSRKYGLKYYISGHRFLKRLVSKGFLRTCVRNGCRYYGMAPGKQDMFNAIWSL